MRYAIYENGRNIGDAVCEISNTKIKISASCAMFDGIKRLRMIDKYGNSVNIRVMEPCGDKMVCEKSLSLDSLTVNSYDDISHFEIGENSMPINRENDVTFTLDECIFNAYIKNKEKLRINNESRSILQPYSDKTELIFSFAAQFLYLSNINGEKYMSLYFDERGFPKYCEDI